MSQRINRCSHCGCDEPIHNPIDGKLYCNNCGMSLEKLEGGLMMTNDDENMKRLIASVKANHAYIAERLKEICQEEDCIDCEWYDRNTARGCVWRTADILAPWEWRTDNGN